MEEEAARDVIESDPVSSGEADREVIVPFDSLEVLAATHTELLRQQVSAEGADDPEFLNLVRELIERGRETGALLESRSERRTAQSLINYWVTVLNRAGVAELPDSILVPSSQPERRDLANAECPYVGLKPYTEANRHRFYGREGITGRLIKRLADNGLVMLVGPAGSGKTSIINAGVVPHLKRGDLPDSKQWHYFEPIAPGREPLTALGSLLTSRGEAPAAQIGPEVEKLLNDTNYLAQQLDDKKFAGRPVLIVVDRFEEVFTLCKDEPQREAFIANLVSLIKSSEEQTPKHLVILIVRSDRTNYFIQRDDLKDLYRRSEVRVYPLREIDLRDVIKEPARQIGLKFQVGLVKQLVSEIYGDPAGLPLLQFALFKLWENREGDTITWAAMNKLQNCQWALVQSAKAFYESQTIGLRNTARLVLVKMVRLTDTLEVVGDRVRCEEFHKAGEPPERVNFVLEGLIQARLVRVTKCEAPLVSQNAEGIKTGISSDDQFQLVHDSLWRDWELFTSWLKRLRETLVMRQRLESLAVNWAVLGRKDRGLLDKYQLHEAKSWMESPQATELGYDPDLAALVNKSQHSIARATFGRRAWLLITFALLLTLLFGLYSQARLRQKNSELELEKTKRESENAFRVANVLKNMTSQLPDDRLLALSEINSLVQEQKMHPKIGAAIISMAIKDGDRRIADKAMEIAKQVSISKDALAQSIGNAAYGDASLAQELENEDALVPRFYIYLASSDQEGRANKIKVVLEEKGYIVPPFRVVGGRAPRANQLRYYSQLGTGGANADSILTLLKEVDGNSWSNESFSSDSSDEVRRGTFEIWLAGQFAQNGTLVINLEDEDRTATEGLGLEVFIASLTNPEQKSIRSKSGSVYSLLPGKYNLTAKIKGYQRINQTFSIREGKETLISLPLRRPRK
jgi:hypothetical protein